MATLECELVPSTIWYSNVRSAVSSTQWTRCKEYVKGRSGSKCEICGGVGRKWPVECHEIWSYDDESHVQTLVGLIALCPTCHSAKHIGRLSVKATLAEYERVLAHIRSVNGWTHDQLIDHIHSTFEVWEERSRHGWVLDITMLKSLGIELDRYVFEKGHRP